jgi:hypothetical protein
MCPQAAAGSGLSRMRTVGIRGLKNRLSEYIRLVEAGRALSAAHENAGRVASDVGGALIIQSAVVPRAGWAEAAERGGCGGNARCAECDALR